MLPATKDQKPFHVAAGNSAARCLNQAELSSASEGGTTRKQGNETRAQKNIRSVNIFLLKAGI